MKEQIYILFFLLGLLQSKAQNTEVFFGNIDKVRATKGEIIYKWVTTIEDREKIEQLFNKKGTMLKSTPYFFIKNWNPIKKDSVSKWIKHGIEIVWDEGKIKSTEAQFRLGFPHGYSKTYYPTGELIKKDSFYHGVLQNSYFYYDTGESFLTYEKEIEDVSLPQKKDVMAFLKDHFSSVYYLLAYEPNPIYLKLTIGTDGIAKDCRIIKSNNSKAKRLFAELAQKVPKFYPAFKDGEPIEQTILLSITRYTSSNNMPLRNGQFNTENLPYERTLYNREKMMDALRW